MHGIFVTPVAGLELTEAVRHEFRVNRVLFVSATKLPRIRNRFRIPETLASYRSRSPAISSILDASATLAVVRHSGESGEVQQESFRLVQEELAILALSQLGFSKRRSLSHPRILDVAPRRTLRYVLFDEGGVSSVAGVRVIGAILPLRLDQPWLEFQEDVLFLPLLKILQGTKSVSRGWRSLLRRTAVIVGRGMVSSHTPTAFLSNMIALEMLLTEQGERHIDVLPKRIEAFLGWAGYWEKRGFSDKIKRIYALRCKYVHQGESDEITKKDLLFADDLVLNILTNIVHHPREFYSKESVIRFAELVRCEQQLGVRPKVRPRTLRMLAPRYTKKDLEQIWE